MAAGASTVGAPHRGMRGRALAPFLVARLEPQPSKSSRRSGLHGECLAGRHKIVYLALAITALPQEQCCGRMTAVEAMTSRRRLFSKP